MSVFGTTTTQTTTTLGLRQYLHFFFKSNQGKDRIIMTESRSPTPCILTRSHLHSPARQQISSKQTLMSIGLKFGIPHNVFLRYILGKILMHESLISQRKHFNKLSRQRGSFYVNIFRSGQVASTIKINFM